MKTSKIFKSILFTSLIMGNVNAFDVTDVDNLIIPSSEEKGAGAVSTGSNFQAEEDVAVTVSSADCNKVNKDFISQRFLRVLMRGKPLRYTKISGGSEHRPIWQVTADSYISGGGSDTDNGGDDQSCFQLDIKSRQTKDINSDPIEVEKYQYIGFRNNIDLTWEKFMSVVPAGDKADGKYKGSLSKLGWERMTEEQKIFTCLTAKGIFKKTSSGVEVEEKIPVEQMFQNPPPFNIDIKHVAKDEMSKVYLAAASPSGSRVLYPGFKKNLPPVSVPGSTGDYKNAKCMQMEPVVQGEDKDGKEVGSMIVAYENQLIERALQVCESGDVTSIDNMLAEVSSRIEESEAYKLAAALLREQRKDALTTTKNELLDDLKSIKKRLLQYKKGGKWKISEETANELMEEYTNKLSELNLKVFDSYKKELKSLMDRRDDAGPQEREAIDKRIGEINTDLGEFYKKRGNTYGKNAFDSLAKRFANDLTIDVEQFFLIAGKLARIRPSSGNFEDRRLRERYGKTLSFDEAAEQINKELRKKEDKLDQWKMTADARSGDTYPARAAQRDMQSIRRRQQRDAQNFRRKEQRYQRYCQATFGGFQTNPVRCRQYNSPQARARRQQRFMRRNAQHQAAYANAAQTYQIRRGYAEEARRRLAEEEGSEDEYGYYYDEFDGMYDYEDDFMFDDGYHMGSYNMGIMNSQMSNPYGGPARRNMGFQQQQPQQYGPQALPYSMNFLGGGQQQMMQPQFAPQYGAQRRF